MKSEGIDGEIGKEKMRRIEGEGWKMKIKIKMIGKIERKSSIESEGIEKENEDGDEKGIEKLEERFKRMIMLGWKMNDNLRKD